MKKLLYFNLLFLTFFPLQAQIKGDGGTTSEGYPILSLQQCIQMAIDCSNDILQSRTDSLSAEYNLSAGIYQFLPNVTAQLGESISLGRSENSSGVIMNRSSANTEISIGATYTVFSGLRRLNDISEAKIQREASKSSLQGAKDAIAIDIIGMYYQVLMQEELYQLSVANIERTRSDLEYTKAMVEAGKWPLAKQVELEAQLSNEEVNLIDSQNELYLTRLNLALNINYRDADSLAIITPDVDNLVELAYTKLVSPEKVYQYAMENRAEIRAADRRIQAAETAISTAKTGFIPTLNLNAGYGTTFYYPFERTQQQMMEDFPTQLKNNGSWYFGFTLSVPIFDAMQTPTNIRTAEVKHILAKIDHKRTREALNRQILTARANAVTASKKIPAAKAGAETNKRSLRMTTDSFEAGRSTALELEQAKNRALQAEKQLIQAKYDFIYKASVLEHYMGTADLL